MSLSFFTRRIGGIILALVLIASIPLGALAASDSLSGWQTEQSAEALPAFRMDSYTAYIERYMDAPKAETAVPVDISNPYGSEGFVSVQKHDTQTLVLSGADSRVSWQIEVPQTGLYQIQMTYRRGKDYAGVIQRAVLIDGELPFREAGFVNLSPPYRANLEGGEFQRDARGNDIRPEQIPTDDWQTARLKDDTGYQTEPLLFYFDKGTHLITLEAVKGSVEISALSLEPHQTVPPYAQVLEEYQEAGYSLASAAPILIQAEHPERTSDISVFASSDKTSTATTPQSVGNDRLNVIAAEQFRNAGQWVSYRFRIDTPGLYRIALRYRQNTSTAPFVTRRLEIDGSLPFAEAADLRFEYRSAWKAQTLGNGTEDYVFYFDKGEHTIRLIVSMGQWAARLTEMQAIQSELQSLYRTLYRITGSKADYARDYDFITLVPDTVQGLVEVADRLYSLIDTIDAMAGNSGHLTASLKKTAYQTKYMGQHHREIARYMKPLEDNISAMRTWILNLSLQPMTLDALCVFGAGKQPMKADDSIFHRILYAVESFFISFLTDYETVSSGDSDNAITVWMTSGRDQLQTVRRLTDAGYTPKNPGGVNLQLVAQGTLMPATLAGIGPDVVIAGGSEVDFALRGAILPLDDMDGFAKVAARFEPGTFTSLKWNGRIYALPETQNFLMMFCRDDILYDLGLKTPETWDDLHYILTVLTRNRMTVGLPSGLAGMALLLYQQGKSFFTEDGTASTLADAATLSAFDRLMKLFIEYQLPIEYDFANRFRSGEMPIGIVDYTVYNQLELYAPDIKGLWSMAPVPGTRRGDVVDHTSLSTVVGSYIMSRTRQPEQAWEFLKWWSSTETQSAFALGMESLMGPSAKQATANLEALARMSWTREEQAALTAQRKTLRAIPVYPGSYMLSRNIGFAFNRVYQDHSDPSGTLLDYVKEVDMEMARKRAEFVH